MPTPTATATEIDAKGGTVAAMETRSIATIIVRVRIAVVAVMRGVIIPIVAPHVSRAMPVPVMPIATPMN
jgi:hypothetical protein